MAWNDAVVVNGGLELLNQTGGKFYLDYAAGGSEIVDAKSLMAQTALKAQKQTLSIVGVQDVEQGKKLNILITSQGLASGYDMRQIGIWAHVDDGPARLFAIIQDSRGVSIPSQAEMPDFAMNFYAVIKYSGEAEFQLSVDSEALVSQGDMRAAIGELIDGLAVRRMDLTIPTSGWTQTGTGRYPYSRDIPVDGATAQMIPDLTVLEAGEATAIACSLAPWVETLEGAVRVSAASVPSAPIPASLTLQGDASGFVLSSGDGGGGGVSDHRLLTQRDAADQHPISAITGLSEALEFSAPVIVKVQLVDSSGSAFKSYNVKCYPAATGVSSYSINFSLGNVQDAPPNRINIIPPEQHAFTGLYASSGVVLNVGENAQSLGRIVSDGTIEMYNPVSNSSYMSWVITGSFTLEVA